MKKLHSKISQFIALSALTISLVSCGGGGGGGDTNVIASNPEFLAKSAAVNFSQINLYEGHVSLTNRDLTSLDVGSLNSGELISIGIEFEVSAPQEDYFLSVELVPESVIDALQPGDTLGEISNNDITSLKNVNIINLGSAYIDNIKPGALSAIVHAKLPTLGADKKYRIVVLPSLAFLALDNEIAESDMDTVPLLIDDEILTISKLDNIAVKLINIPDLTKNNAFTQLEVGGKFDANGYSIDPLFQTSIQVDISTFNPSEKVSLSLTWLSPSGVEFPLGLLSTDDNNEPIITEKAQFTIDASDSAFIAISVVAYASERTQGALLKESININDIADNDALNAEFSLQVFYDDEGSEVSAGNAYSLSLPLVRQDNRVIKNTVEEAVGFKVLRAGTLNNACLAASGLGIDSGLFANDSTNTINAVNCIGGKDNMLWRYDSATKHIVSKVTDLAGNNYCIAIFDSNGVTKNDYHLVECQYASGIGSVVMPVSSQRYNFEGNKIKAEGANGYLGVIFSGDPVKEVQIQSAVDAPDFFTDTNGLNLSTTGRLFHAEKFDAPEWGDARFVSAKLSYGAEAFVDYLPILGSTTQGHVTFTGTLFGHDNDIIDFQFALKKHFLKKLSFSGQNSPDVKVENGALLSLKVAGFEGYVTGSLTEKTITETYSAQTPVEDIIANAEIPDFDDIDIKPDVLSYSITEELFKFTYWGLVIPIEITGGISSGANVSGLLSSPGVGLELELKQILTLGGYLNAKANLWLASAELNGDVTLLSQTLNFGTSGGFSAALPLAGQDAALALEFEASLDATMKALKAELTYTLNYPCFLCDGKSTGSIYTTNPEYLFNAPKWVIYEDNVTGSVISY